MTDEEYEEIPWERLLADERRRRSLLPVAIIAGIVVLAAVGWFALHRPPSPPVSTAAPPTLPPSVPSTTSTLPPTTTTTSALLLGERDLRSSGADIDAALVALRAETFVADFFTVDGDEGAISRLHDAFAPGLALPALPHEQPDTGGSTYVEWVHAYQVLPVDAGRWVAAVAFRTVFRSGDTWRRAPLRAVLVSLVLDGSGGTGVTDLPMPIPTPLQPTTLTVAIPDGDPPSGAADIALAYARSFSATADVITIAGTSQGWRAVVGVDGRSGIRWPMAIRSDLLP